MPDRDDRRVVRTIWNSTDRGRTWRPCEVLAGSQLSNAVSHPPDGWWDDGYGNLYRNAPLANPIGDSGDDDVSGEQAGP